MILLDALSYMWVHQQLKIHRLPDDKLPARPQKIPWARLFLWLFRLNGFSHCYLLQWIGSATQSIQNDTDQVRTVNAVAAYVGRSVSTALNLEEDWHPALKELRFRELREFVVPLRAGTAPNERLPTVLPVSYTHLTLPTICSV